MTEMEDFTHMLELQKQVEAQNRVPIPDQQDDEDEEWYIRFLHWFQQNYFGPIPDHEVPLIRFHFVERLWYRYNEQKGVYEVQDPDEIKKIFFEWADSPDVAYHTSESITTHAISRLRAYVGTRTPWDSNKEYDNFKNGILNLKTLTLHSHTPVFLSKKQIDRNFRPPEKGTEWVAPRILKTICDLPKNGDRIRQYYLLMVHRDHTQELFLMLYGVAGAGKSTALTIPANMFGRELTSSTTFYKLGQRFGTALCYDKRNNVNPEMAIKRLYNDAVGMMKALTGGDEGADGNLEVEFKGMTQFSWPICCFFMFGINQLPAFAEEVHGEILSIMRRSVLVDYSDVVPPKPCPEFKSLMKDPDFLDDLYWYLIHTPVEPMKVPDEETWKYTNLQEWLRNSDPLLRVLQDLYIYEKGSSLICKSVLEEVQSAYENEGMLIPDKFQQELTFAFRSMKVYRDDQRGLKAQYCNLKHKDGSIPIEEPKPIPKKVVKEEDDELARWDKWLKK